MHPFTSHPLIPPLPPHPATYWWFARCNCGHGRIPVTAGATTARRPVSFSTLTPGTRGPGPGCTVHSVTESFRYSAPRPGPPPLPPAQLSASCECEYKCEQAPDLSMLCLPVAFHVIDLVCRSLTGLCLNTLDGNFVFCG
eukprot:765121-Hanusia_phi.AAC.3